MRSGRWKGAGESDGEGGGEWGGGGGGEMERILKLLFY